MFTRCPGCHTVHPLNAALLAQGAGKYRCGKCNKVNNALEALFDNWPDAGESAAKEGSLPELGIAIDLKVPKDAGFSDGKSLAEDEGAGTRRKVSRIAWSAAALVLLIVMVINLADLFRKDIQDNVKVQQGLAKVGLREMPVEKPFRDLAQIQLVASEMRSHPSRPKALRLSATIVNRAGRMQAYPVLEVILLDLKGQALASRQFEPAEYLAEGADIGGGMSPEAYLPVVLDMADPGQQAVGFELNIQ
jgi:predicted Zn finger-like uncharacterized protein